MIDQRFPRGRKRAVTIVAAAYFGMLAVCLGIFTGLIAVVFATGSGWPLIPAIAAGIASLRIGDWWLPPLIRRFGPAETG